MTITHAISQNTETDIRKACGHRVRVYTESLAIIYTVVHNVAKIKVLLNILILILGIQAIKN